MQLEQVGDDLARVAAGACPCRSLHSRGRHGAVIVRRSHETDACKSLYLAILPYDSLVRRNYA